MTHVKQYGEDLEADGGFWWEYFDYLNLAGGRDTFKMRLAASLLGCCLDLNGIKATKNKYAVYDEYDIF